MFFYLAKFGWFIAQPSTFLVLLLVAGLITIGFGAVRTGAIFVLLSALGLVVAGFLPLGIALLLPLEDRFPRLPPTEPVTGIIVLGGALDQRMTAVRGDFTLGDAAERLTETLRLARVYPAAKIVFTGGSAAIVPDGTNEAEPAAAFLKALGLDPARLVIESASRDTAENARMSKAIVQPKPGETWLLVTSAWHMPRAVGCFRAAGWPVTAWPTDYRTGGAEDLYGLQRVSTGLAMTDMAVKEWLGLLAYRLAGRTDALFPGP